MRNYGGSPHWGKGSWWAGGWQRRWGGSLAGAEGGPGTGEGT